MTNCRNRQVTDRRFHGLSTIRILVHYRVADPDVACAALLHDVVEDQRPTSPPAAGRRP
jgi:(p)ppGpp synthase/HD superfamily hydrolase